MIVASVILGLVYSMPNFFNSSKQNQSFNFLPGKKINLGLDLKGGSYLLLKADMDIVFSEKLESLLSDIRSSLRKSKIGYKKLSIQNNTISFQKRKNYSNEKIKSIIFSLDKNLFVENKLDSFFIKFSEQNKKNID